MDERLLNDLLECSVCLDRLDTSSKVLPCQHTFCRKCLEEIVASHPELRCPECRVLVESRIDELPTNVLLMRILEGMKTAEFNSQNLNKSNRNANNILNNLNNQHLHHQQNPPTGYHHHQHSSHIKTNKIIEQNITARSNQTPLDLAKVPHAKAFYDFSSNETSDISFKKGDIVMLKKRVDHNWCVGEVNGKEGFVPINHIQVIVPLPVPQCKALYDFSMEPNEEEGCLTFKKGSIINVLRRVDHNWAEGRVADTIGIFPISFVEMNALGKQLMDASIKHLQPSNSVRTVPPTPFDLNASDSSSTTTTSPNSTASTTSSNSSTAPSSPTSHFLTASQNSHVKDGKEKRHSLTAFIGSTGSSSGGNKAPQTNRHSAEILNVPDLDRQNESKSTGRNQHDVINYQKSKNSTSTQPTLPATYIALYPYKPQKPDELELKKGSIYYVTERCQDGWFKGANRSQKSGVFPGNYVTVWKNRENNHATAGSRSQNPATTATNPSNSATQSTNGHHPPELPPRNTNSTSIWTKSIQSNCIDSFFNRKPSTSATNNPQTTDKSHSPAGESSTPQQPNAANKEKKDSSAVSLMKRLTNIKRSKSPTPNTSAYSMDNPVFEDTPGSSSIKSNIQQMVHPVHVRSGSCPSQLLQNLPVDLNAANSAYAYGSQRIKSHKERPSTQHLRTNGETNTKKYVVAHEAPASTSSAHTNAKQSQVINHRKSQSLDATAIASQINNTPSKAKIHTPVRERFRCIVPYPPNSEYELELRIGDIVFVHKKRDNGWYKGTQQRSGRTGLFPASFVESDI